MTAHAATGSPVRKIPLDLRLRRLAVRRVLDLSPSIRRVALGGPDLAGFECHGPSDHAKVFFPPEPDGDLVLPELADWSGRQDPRHVVREYTVRTYVPSSDELVLDMAVHAHGPAGRWAAQADVGRELGVLGPKTSKVGPTDRAWYLLVADETGLPALTNWLERLPAGPRVHAFVEVGGPQDEVRLPQRAGVDVTWLHRGDAEAGTTRLLADAVAALPVPDGGPGWVWAGAEAGAVRAVRRDLTERGVDRKSLSMTGYWRLGVANFDHKSPEANA
ncbi:siderophore-interacting protein [Actinotalea ferrariae]|uniref:siderophore-interacting protein n=1 Tax=Actinotalea ferrariae TaxID=1386098 RepID=UPI001C8CAE7F|nr:siderophore-interacting protein [Actinotalea ferrariae]MBX9244039.1 siderophore-interacting protein [Actinotalea ferrariae]